MRPRQGRINASLPVNEMAAIQLGGDLDGEIEISERCLRPRQIRNRGREIPADGDEDLDLAADHGFERGYDIVAVLVRRLEAEATLQPLQKLR